MKLQRQYANGACTHVRVIHSGISREQNFSQRLVGQAMADGWMERKGATLILRTDGEPLRYAIRREPGYYCKSTGAAIPVSTFAWGQFMASGQGNLSRPEALAWLAAHGKAADDYEITTAFECTLDAAQHDQHRAVHDAAGTAVAAQTLICQEA